MQVLDKKLQQRVTRASKKLGIPEGEVVSRAVSTYLKGVENTAALYQELRMWDILSAKTMRKYKF